MKNVLSSNQLPTGLTMNYHYLNFILLIGSIGTIKGAHRANGETRLLQHLISNNDPGSRPVAQGNNSVLVKFSLKFLQILDMVEKNQTLITRVVVHEEWRDELLRWSPKRFDGLQHIIIPSDRLWVPDTYIFNNAEKGHHGFMFVKESKAFVRYDGHVFWSLPLIIKSACTVDVKYFPFDNQRCHIRFGSGTYAKSQMDLALQENAYDLSQYTPNPEFRLVDTTLKIETLSPEEFAMSYFQLTPDFTDNGSKSQFPQAVMWLHIKRKPIYYFYTVVAPVLVLCSMMVVTFLLPCDSGDKVGIGLTVFLSLYVLQLSIAEHIPESNSLPLISLFMILVMTLNSISLVIATIVINLKKRGDTRPCPEVPEAVLIFCSKVLAKLTFTRKLEFRDFYSTCRQEERYLRKVSVRSPSMDFSALYNAQHSGVLLKDVLGDATDQPDYLKHRRGAAISNNSASATNGPSPTKSMFSSVQNIFANTLQIPSPMFSRRPSGDQSASSRKLMATRNRKLEWYFIAEVVDKILFILFFIALMVTVLTSLVIVPEIHKYD